MTDLLTLLYVSRSLLDRAVHQHVTSIDDILSRSRLRNASQGITGALLFDDEHFVQFLEGPREAVEMTFERIKCDPHHTDVRLLWSEVTDRRRFAHWDMAFVGETASHLPNIADLLRNSANSQRDGRDILEMMMSVVLFEESRQSF